MEKKIVKIEEISDSHDCEICGYEYAQGFRIFVDGENIATLKPIAHCFDGQDYERGDAYKLVLEHLGYEVHEVIKHD